MNEDEQCLETLHKASIEFHCILLCDIIAFVFPTNRVTLLSTVQQWGRNIVDRKQQRISWPRDHNVMC